MSLRPRTWLDVAKGVPRSFAPVPIKHFGVLLGHILNPQGDVKSFHRYVVNSDECDSRINEPVSPGSGAGRRAARAAACTRS